MKEELVTFETAKLAKEKGFNEWCQAYYNTATSGDPILESQVFGVKTSDTFNYIVPACTQSLLQKWLREVHNLSIVIDSNHSGWFYTINKTNGTFIKEYVREYEEDEFFDSYEQSLEFALQESLKLITK